MLYGLPGVLTKMQTKSIPYTFNRGDYYLEPNCQMRLGFIGKRALAQTGSAEN